MNNNNNNSFPSALTQRPQPPSEMLALDAPASFVPAPDLRDWIVQNIISESGPLFNPEHGHLSDAHLGVLWSNVANKKMGKIVVGETEIFRPKGGAWQKGRQTAQIVGWFGDIPDFLITFDAAFAAAADDATFCAVAEHELLHAAQAMDKFGLPKFNKKTGQPKYALRGHDCEEFVSVVARYGLGAVAPEVSAMVAAAQREPLIARAKITAACGTCLRLAAQ